MNWWDYVTGRAHDPNDNANGGELGIDLKTPVNTPLYSPWSGTVTYVGMSRSTGGIVKILTNIPGFGPIYEYFLHLNTINVRKGDFIDSSTLLGLSGGTQPGAGGWPHVEFGLFRDPQYASQYWGFRTGSTLDPTKLIDNMRRGIMGLGVGGPMPPIQPDTCGPKPDPANYHLGVLDPNYVKDLAAWDLCKAQAGQLNPTNLISIQWPDWFKNVGDWISGANSWFNAQRILKLVFGVILLGIALAGLWNTSGVGQSVNNAASGTLSKAINGPELGAVVAA